VIKIIKKGFSMPKKAVKKVPARTEQKPTAASTRALPVGDNRVQQASEPIPQPAAPLPAPPASLQYSPNIPSAPQLTPPAVAPPAALQHPPNTPPAVQLSQQAARVLPPAGQGMFPNQQYQPQAGYQQPHPMPPAGSVPSNVPQAFKLNYTPKETEFVSFAEQACYWLTPQALKYYEPMVQPYSENATALIPWPMYYSQDPERFCPSRFPGNSSEFDEWAFQVPFVKRCGTDFIRQYSFIPYSDEQATINDFVSSPYQALRHALVQMHKDKAFSEHSIWYRLTNRWSDPKLRDGQSEYLPKVQLFRLVVGILLSGVESLYVRSGSGKGKRQTVHKNYYDPSAGMYGKGAKQDERLVCLAISDQVWRDLARCMNTATSNNEYAYADPVNPLQPAVLYSWAHKRGQCPVPNQVSTTSNEGSSGIVSGGYYFQGRLIANGVSVPPQYYCRRDDYSDTVCPSSEYYAKTLHIAQAIRRLTDHYMACLMAESCCDAKAVFEIGWRGTAFEGMLSDPEFLSKFEHKQQRFIWNAQSVYDGAPVSVPVTQPQGLNGAFSTAPMPPQGNPGYTQPQGRFGYGNPQPQGVGYAPLQGNAGHTPVQNNPAYPQPVGYAPPQQQQYQTSALEQQIYEVEQQWQQQAVQRQQAAVAQQYDYSQPTIHEQQQLGMQQQQQQQPQQQQAEGDGEIYVDDFGYQVDTNGNRIYGVDGQPIYIGLDDVEPEDGKESGGDSLDGWSEG
jgi:hypothetical protein